MRRLNIDFWSITVENNWSNQVFLCTVNLFNGSSYIPVAASLEARSFIVFEISKYLSKCLDQFLLIVRFCFNSIVMFLWDS